MKTLIITLFALQPITSWYVQTSIFGLGLLEMAAIVMNVLLVLAVLNGMISRKFSIVESGTDLVILIFIVWCLLLLVHPETILKEAVRLILPLFNFVVICRYFRSKKYILRLLFWVLVGFSVPILASAACTFMGVNLDQEIYWTGIKRYRGVYANVHTMGLSMVMYIMMLVIYFEIAKRWGHKTSLIMKIVFVSVALLALYCLLASVVRTAFLAIMVFFIIYFWYRKKLVLVLASLLMLMVSMVYVERVQLIFFDVIDAVEEDGDIEQAGSGRIWIWKQKVGVLNSQGFGAWFYGVGIGNFLTANSSQLHKGSFDSHNDYLALIMSTGMVGLIVYLVITFLMFKQVMKLPAHLRYAFLAYMVAIVVANFASNAFIGRFGLSQMFMMVMGIMYSIVSIERYDRRKITRPSVAIEQLNRPSINHAH